jgi:hypothetical protein
MLVQRLAEYIYAVLKVGHQDKLCDKSGIGYSMGICGKACKSKTLNSRAPAVRPDKKAAPLVKRSCLSQ